MSVPTGSVGGGQTPPPSAAATGTAPELRPHHELYALAYATDPPHHEEEVPRWVGARQDTCAAGGCGATDNHPKIVKLFDIGLDSEREERWHHDCHYLAHRDEHSAHVVQQSGGAKGHALRLFMFGDPTTGQAPAFVAPPTEVDAAAAATGTEG